MPLMIERRASGLLSSVTTWTTMSRHCQPASIRAVPSRVIGTWRVSQGSAPSGLNSSKGMREPWMSWGTTISTMGSIWVRMWTLPAA